ncbi:MAG: hypothetical protein ABS21_00690 [SAR86 cluster bacterium BACL1 MAG-121105-bin34]|jgi:uncharacterized protein (DUF2141 family)|uniref:DUF2141 domain-containing protein n=2 Tax=SAR86 cluster TaxID=62672 RepID=A0A0R2UA94_9GAMM|nr:MAG: hypothetical protein ABR59_08040 [SAR86 cluster bacterium BACL1 MAG-120507-bin14]KRO38803.1 MAG: hypothetical protein ABR63_05555 [SAR86 cluster bacterium BACL1 MAG-120920-bin57]KRO96391.1 MAG: hypothetical protein ABS10_03435 [SAR86 cluster bacterium BACL1 MAG-120820-bin45]KRO97682.1 MAG: hypothetical protein ABS11_04485 [SAR86 cluster bacterium BACL1 MAG-120828-bin5]KRO99563.1 MAG: hypothetical protein ABS15_03665 [SAR86 cluster bacterium BACL1 MAG-120823-bin87]KRO99835.1 MAG: hypoth
MRSFLNHTFFLFVCILASDCFAGELIINLGNQDKSGTLMLALYDNPEDYENSVKKEKQSEVGVLAGIEAYIESQKLSQFTLDLPDGSYAIALFIDLNGNKKIDKNFLGIPKEQYGFSNNAMGTLSAPTFEQAQFTVAGVTVQNINLK